MIPVISERMTHIGFQPESEGADTGRFHVVFTDGTKGHYADVPISAFRGVRDAQSKGSALHDLVIRPGYRFVREP